MVVNSSKKVKKQRGYNSHGWGHKKKHRGRGSRGGAGFAGAFRHKKIMVAMDHPDHFAGRKGFTRPVDSSNKTINVVTVSQMGGKEIDLTSLGYDKLLGRGKVESAVTVKVKAASKSAIEKIEQAGGKVVLE